MFRKLLHNRKAQNTAEYALLIALVVAGIIAMQTYAQRALQARVKDASDKMTSADVINGTDLGIFKSTQYEPYYMQSEYTVNRVTNETQNLGVNLVSKQVDNQRSRNEGGFQVTTYNESGNYGPEITK